MKKKIFQVSLGVCCDGQCGKNEVVIRDEMIVSVATIIILLFLPSLRENLFVFFFLYSVVI